MLEQNIEGIALDNIRYTKESGDSYYFFTLRALVLSSFFISVYRQVFRYTRWYLIICFRIYHGSLVQLDRTHIAKLIIQLPNIM